MAFLGLTLLGPQSSFSSEYRHSFGVDLFEEKDLITSFRSVVGGEGKSATAADLPAILRHLFHGPPPAHELERVTEAFGAEAFSAAAAATPTVDEARFLSLMKALQESAGREPADRAKAATFNSHDLMLDQRRRQRRGLDGPKELFTKPLTLTQEIGWRAHEAVPEKRHPKKHCEETKFASKLRQAGYI